MCGKVCWEAGFSVSGRRQGPAFQPVCRGGRVQMPEQVDRPVAAMRSGDSLLLCSLCGRIVGNSSGVRQDGFGGGGFVSGILHRAVSRGPCRCVSGAGVRYEVLGLPRDSSLLWQARVVPKIDVPGTTRTGRRVRCAVLRRCAAAATVRR